MDWKKWTPSLRIFYLAQQARLDIFSSQARPNEKREVFTPSEVVFRKESCISTPGIALLLLNTYKTSQTAVDLN